MTGTVYSGINGIYAVLVDDGPFLECRIKGKVLREDERDYNPLAPGDRVGIEDAGRGKGLILTRLPRRNRFARWNRKREAWQVVAANLDLIVVVASARVPPFRPRFVDRVLIAARQGGVDAAVLLNKTDQGVEETTERRLAAWESLGIPVWRTSVADGRGVDGLAERLAGRTSVLFGPSGVGKSSLLNLLVPGSALPTGDVSAKHDRGRHVTNFGRMLDAPSGGRLIDTPGVREILVRGIDPDELPHWFPEFEGPMGSCAFQPCSHRHEPGCAVIGALEAGAIHPDRYENYLRIRDELEDANAR